LCAKNLILPPEHDGGITFFQDKAVEKVVGAFLREMKEEIRPVTFFLYPRSELGPGDAFCLGDANRCSLFQQSVPL
jgi:hypothetical protein